jgi:hypothetical protein
VQQLQKAAWSDCANACWQFESQLLAFSNSSRKPFTVWQRGGDEEGENVTAYRDTAGHHHGKQMGVRLHATAFLSAGFWLKRQQSQSLTR